MINITLPAGSATAVEFAPFSFSKAAQDFQRDMSRIVENLRRFNENSSKSSDAKNMNQMRQISATNESILRDISFSVTTFKNNLNRNRGYLPSREIKESPSFSTLMKMADGYEQWLKYQKINQNMLSTCINNAGNKLKSLKKCTLNNFSKGLENERLGRIKLEQAAREYNLWMARFGHSK